MTEHTENIIPTGTIPEGIFVIETQSHNFYRITPVEGGYNMQYMKTVNSVTGPGHWPGAFRSKVEVESFLRQGYWRVVPPPVDLLHTGAKELQRLGITFKFKVVGSEHDLTFVAALHDVTNEHASYIIRREDDLQADGGFWYGSAILNFLDEGRWELV